MKTILVAVSGGPDSIYLLNKFRGNKKFNLIVCHINYKKRKSADRDEKIVENFCKNNNIKLETLIVTKEVEEQYIKFPNFQEKARHIRYDFFQKIGKENNTNILYVGHHKDDFIETAIMQERRSNDYLFYGLKEKNFLKDLTILRPLLNIYKNEILEYLFSNGISFGIDETNNDPKYERNKVRINLSKQSFKEKENIYKHFKTINKSKELISKKIDKLYLKWEDSNFELLTLNKMNSDIKIKIIYKWLTTIKDDININKNKIIEIINFLEKSNLNKKYRISDNLNITIKNKRAIIV